jgi:hypothetical protein
MTISRLFNMMLLNLDSGLGAASVSPAVGFVSN